MIPLMRRQLPYDFAVYDELGQLSVLLETNARAALNRTWAKEWHELATKSAGTTPPAVIVLVTLDHIYGWRRGAEAPADPDWQIDARPLLRPYFQSLKIRDTDVDPGTFDEIILMWIRDISLGDAATDLLPRENRALLEPLRGGEIVRQEAVA